MINFSVFVSYRDSFTHEVTDDAGVKHYYDIPRLFEPEFLEWVDITFEPGKTVWSGES